MADFRAVAAVGEAVVHLLRTSYRPQEIDSQLPLDKELEFEVYSSRQFRTPMANGLSLFLYRVFPVGTSRTPPGRVNADGTRQQSLLPLELHFLLTVWAGSASLQNALAGWSMRILEDTPILPAGVLNAVAPGGFRPDETVQLGLAELRTEDLLRIWDVLGVSTYQLSVPYYARVVNIETVRTTPAELDDVYVQTRILNPQADGGADVSVDSVTEGGG